jgi:hypothetical protein
VPALSGCLSGKEVPAGSWRSPGKALLPQTQVVLLIGGSVVARAAAFEYPADLGL